MDDDAPDETGPESRGDRWLGVVVLGGMIVLLFSVLEMLGWLNGGGVASLVHAHAAIARGAPSVDFDAISLHNVAIMLMCIVTIVACNLVGVDLYKGAGRFLLPLLAVGGGFALDIAFDESAMSHYAAAYGYRRCREGDHAVGSGKGRVHFDNYVLLRLPCPPPHTDTAP